MGRAVPIKVDCIDKTCPGPLRLVRVVARQKGKNLMEGECTHCNTEQVAVYEPRTHRVPYRAVVVEKTWRNGPVDAEGEDGTYEWTEWRDRNDERVGYLMDGCFRLDLGPFHIGNAAETDFWKRVDPDGEFWS